MDKKLRYVTFKKLLNLTNGGDGLRGLKRSIKHRTNISLALKGIFRSKESIEKRRQTMLKKGGYHPSEETLRRLSIARKGITPSRHTIEAARKARLGSKHSVEIRAKISARLRSPEINAKLVEAQSKRTHDAVALIAYSHARRGTKMPPGTGKKISDANRGRKHTPETLAKMSISALNRTTESLGFLGKTHSDETKRKISEKLTGRKFSPEALAKRAETMRTTDLKERIADKLRGRTVSPEILAKRKANRAAKVSLSAEQHQQNPA